MKACVWKKAWVHFLIGLLGWCGFAQSFAKEALTGQQLLAYLSQEKQALNAQLTTARQKNNEKPVTTKDIERLQQQNKANQALNALKIANLENFLLAQNKLQESVSLQLKKLQKSTRIDWTSLRVQQKMERIHALHQMNKQSIALLHDTIVLANRYQGVLEAQGQELLLQSARLNLHHVLNQLREKDEFLAENLSKLYQKSMTIQKNIEGFEQQKTSTYLLEATLILNNQLINLTQYKRAEIKIQRELAKADFRLLKSPDVRTLQMVTEEYKNCIAKLSDLEQSLRKVASLLKTQHAFLSGKLKESYQSVLTIINQRIENLMIQEQTLQEDLENHQNELKKQLSSRTTFAAYHIDSIPALLEQLATVPGQTIRYIKQLASKVVESYQWQETLHQVLFWVALGLTMLASRLAHAFLRQKRTEKERSRLSGYLFEGLITLFSKSLPQLTVLAGLVLTMALNNIMYSSYQLLANLLLLWVGFRSMILIARLSLLERVSDSSGTDVRLYHRIKWTLIAGGWIIGFMRISQLLPLDLFLQEVFSRLFMVYIGIVSIVGWLSRGVILQLLSPLLRTKKRYIRTAVMVLIVALPVTLFSTAIIGLSGYINLAWTMSRYQFTLVSVLSVFVLMRGLLVDGLELISEWMIRRLKNGWLWVEVWLKPVDKLLRLTLVCFAVYMLFKLYGWQGDSWVMNELKWVMKYPLLEMSGLHVALSNIVNFIVLLYVFGWAAKWTREFGYRWLYRNTRDSGIRNSLSVFTQYAVILVGAVVTLRALGLDFSGMSMVIGGLAVGMGFGLRDFASNVIGGLMLLIERPVREGDIVTLGEYEGTVSHIGIRTMRISSWDNMDVLVPNAETFSKPFTNWTHQDNIVRTVVPIKVSRADDPIMVQQMILDVLALIPEIVSMPASQVLLKQIDEALVSFEIRYYINIQQHNRFEVRSKVLFAVMEQFKAAGIQAPIPPIRLEVQDNAHEVPALLHQPARE